VADPPLFRLVDAVTVPVPDLDEGLSFYSDRLGHEVIWRNDAVGQVGLRLPDSTTEIVLSTRLGYEPNWLVDSLDEAVERVLAAGGRLLAAPGSIPVGRVAVLADPFGNPIVVLEISARYDSRAT
jgi:predicted enzyme related to lactoylglutathione lyase